MNDARRERSNDPWGRARSRHASALALLLAVVLGCASQPAKAPAGAPEEAPEPSAPEAPTAAEPVAADSASSTASPAPSSSAEPAAAATNSEFDQDIANIEKMAGLRPDQAAAPSGRQIVYRVSSGELTVEIDAGLVLKPKAKAVKQESGAYSVEIEVVAESKDGQQYWITSPGNRPLSIAGEVLVRSDETRRFADERKGEGEIVVPSSGTRRFRQSWPAKGQPKLWGGQKATLEVGFWGMHGDDERERPVKRLFIVKLSAVGRPTALIMPPDVVASE